MKSILIIGIFSGEKNSHGGEKRTAQIREALLNVGFEIENLKLVFERKVKIKKLISYILFYGFLVIKLKYKISVTNFSYRILLKEIYRYGLMNDFIEKNKKIIANSSKIIFENSFPDFNYLPYLLKTNFKSRIFGCIHNLESLVPYQLSSLEEKYKFKTFQEEINSLKYCDHVFTISYEENWLLNLLNVKSSYLPFYPTKDDYENLSKIRNERKTKFFKKSYLILGSITNQPTKIGIESLLNFLNNTNLYNDIEFYVAGFGTELLKNKYSNKQINILGTLSQTDLYNLMVTVRAAIISQGFSSGVLTKIPEFLIAGIPVICDLGSARTFFARNDISVFNNFNQLSYLLNKEYNIPEELKYPLDEINYFKKVILIND